MTLFIIAIAAALVISCMCSLFEAVLYSTRVGHVEAARKKSVSEAAIFASLKERIALPIAAILILNTMSNTIGAAVAGSQARVVLGEHWVFTFSLIFSVAILFFSEILPKTIGVVYWARLWRLVARPLKFLVWIFYPLIILVQQFTGLLTRGHKHDKVSEAEVRATAWLAYNHGQIMNLERELVANVLRLNDVRAHEILTPRVVIKAVPVDMSLSQAQKEAQTWSFSRIPVYEEKIDNVVGYVLRRDVWAAPKISPDAPLRQIVRKIHFVPETVDCYTLLQDFIALKAHIFMVVDEYGGIEGLVTLEDVLEELVGTEIIDELDTVADMQKMARLKQKERRDKQKDPDK